MTPTEWSKVQYFKPSEFRYPDRVEPALIYALDELRRQVGTAIIVNSDFRPGDPGQHGLGRAADVVLTGLHVIDQFFAAERSGLFAGIGVYPYWNRPGIHVDVRQLQAGQPGARWLRNATGIYVGLNWQNVRFL